MRDVRRAANALAFSQRTLAREIFPRSARLLRPSEYAAVLKHPELSLTSGPLRLRIRKNGMPTARLGMVVPKKGTSHAYRRNRLKRLAREEFRHALGDLPPVDVVVQVFGSVEDGSFRRKLRVHLQSIGQRLHELQT